MPQESTTPLNPRQEGKMSAVCWFGVNMQTIAVLMGKFCEYHVKLLGTPVWDSAENLQF